MKQCAVKNTLTVPLSIDFESYDGTTPAAMASFALNGTDAPLYTRFPAPQRSISRSTISDFIERHRR